MNITVTQEQGRVPVTVLHLAGDLTVESEDQFQEAAHKAIAAGSQCLLLDMAKLNTISSAGMRAIQTIFTELRAGASAAEDKALRQGIRDGTYKSPNLKLLNPSPQVLKVLKMAGFDMFLEIHRDLRTAVASFG